MATDSEESYFGSWKLPTEKISTFGFGSDAPLVAVSGSGGSDYLRYLKDEVIKRFKNTRDDLDGFEVELRDLLSDFFETHYLPFSGQPYNESLEPQLLIAAQGGDSHRLWRTYRKTVNPVSGYISIGLGAPWANVALSLGMWHGERMVSLGALYAVFVAKQHADGCSGDTQMVLLRSRNNPEPVLLAIRQEIDEVEEIFRTHAQVQADQIYWLLAKRNDATDVTAAEFWTTSTLDKMRAELEQIDVYAYATLS